MSAITARSQKRQMRAALTEHAASAIKAERRRGALSCEVRTYAELSRLILAPAMAAHVYGSVSGARSAQCERCSVCSVRAVLGLLSARDAWAAQALA